MQFSYPYYFYFPAAAVAPKPVNDIMVGKQKANNDTAIRRITEDYGKTVLGSETGTEPSFDDVVALRQGIFAATHHLGVYPPAVHALEPVRFRSAVSGPPILETLPEVVPELSSVLAPSAVVSVESRPLPPALLPHGTVTSATDARFARAKDVFIEKLYYSEMDRQKIEKLTRGQSSNLEWYESRWGAITSSMIYDVNRFINGSSKLNPDRLVKKSMGYGQRYMTAPPKPKQESLKWGIAHEDSGRKAYIETQKHLHKNLTVTETGLFVDPTFGYLRASPDGIVSCDCHGKRLLEIKCPYSIRDMTVQEGVQAKKVPYLTTLDNGSFALKTRVNYYDQVQCAMGICGVEVCDFLVWTPKEFLILPIKFDSAHFEQLRKSAQSFFEDHIVPEILTSRLRNQPAPSPNEEEPPNELLNAESSAVVRCHGCGQILPEDDYVTDDKTNASIRCECHCECTKWYCWPCAGLKEELVNWICPICCFTCVSVFDEEFV